MPDAPRQRIDWPNLIAFGLGQLRLAPASFWGMTPRELAAAAGQNRRAPPMTRADLDQLAATYPDKN